MIWLGDIITVACLSAVHLELTQAQIKTKLYNLQKYMLG